MVHNLTDREAWQRQGEEYLRQLKSKPHPILAATQARRAAEGRKYTARAAA